MKTIADGSIAEHQATGPVYLQGGVFPNYRSLVTDVQPVVQAAPSVAPTTQPTVPASTPLPATSAMAPGQPMNPRLLMREHPQPTGQTANQPTQDQVAAMFLPPPPIVDPVQQQPIQQTPPIQPVIQLIQQQVMQPAQQAPSTQQHLQPIQQALPMQRLQPIQQIPVRQQIVQPIQHPRSANASAGFAAPGGQPAQQFVNQIVPEHLVHHAQPDGTAVPQIVPEHLVHNIQPNLHNYQGGNLSYQYQPPSPQAQYQPGGSAQQQFAPQFGQFEPVQQQPQGAAQQRPWADVIADVMREQFGLKPKETGSLYRQPYPEWFERVPIPNRFKVPDFCKFSGQEGVSTYEHISRFLAQCGEASAVDALRVRQQIQVAIEGGKIKFDDSKKLIKLVKQPMGPVQRVSKYIRLRLSISIKGSMISSRRGVMKSTTMVLILIGVKRRVQRLRSRERFQKVEEEINHRLRKPKPRQEWRVKSQVPTADDAAADEVKRLAKGKSVTAAPINMVFTLPAEFGIDQADVDEVEEASAKLVLSPEQAVFAKPEGTENRHLKPLYINGYVNGKPMSKMMADGGATVNLMPYATFKKMGRNAEDLIKTNVVLKDFGGNPSETKGVLNVELTVGSKTIPTTQSKMENPSYYFEGVVEGSNVYAKDTVDDLDDKKGQGFMSADDLEEMDIGPGYNQIFMAEEDIHKTAFRCPGAIGLFEWVVMTFGLKCAGATYQRAINYIYHDLIGWLVEVYIDDVVVKSKEVEDHIADLRKVFERTRKYGLKINPTKCAFGVSAGQFLGFLVHERGIEVTQRSVNAIKKIQPPENKTELQEMIGKINFVRRFISNLSRRLEPFTPLLRLKADQQFTWGAEQQKALDNIKEYLSSSPVLIPPQKGISFRLYLSAGEKSIGSVLIQELEGKERVVFYLNRRLFDAETRYSPVEKLCLCLYFSCTRLRHYLLSNECTVICKADVVRYMLSAPILKGRVGKWIFSLTEFNLRNESPKAIKGQAIADFIVEHRDDSIGSVEIMPWTLFFDGSAKYEAVLKGLQLLKEVEANSVQIMGDSLLVISQLAGEYECKNDTLMVYNEKCLELMKGFRRVTLKHASGYKPMIKDVKVEIAVISADDWRYDVHQYLSNPSQSASRKLRYKTLKYTLLDDELYYRTIDGVLLKCLSTDQAKVAIGEVHEGFCGTHQSAHKMKWLLQRAGYFWPTMLDDCFRYYKGCQVCQKFGAIQRAPASAMNPIIKPWPLRGWGIDMIGMINPPSSKGHKFILVATDYFTKWVEAIPLKKVDSGDAIQFVQEHIIYRFGLPQTITMDQGSIFVSDEFVQFADSVGIKLLNSSPYYAQANGQAEASNKSLIKLIKRKISDYPRQWHTRLAEALWSYRMACHGSIQVPPYKLVYGHEAVLP
uniref:Retrotransposon protein, putative, unclassified n=2 Tax=Oryza sativa subsp. japonica TaxID=39947 RepID=Q8SB13_ORYSJ|nr:Putative gag-pol polyprotein [Oryza sativa Japonica Group]AAP52444.1 retrotransposon protein, putative, unclassified [Oryza sativa Japonica Group]